MLMLPVLESIQDVDGIPDDLKAVFRTAFEINPHELIDMAAARSPFIDQSQSFSLFVANPTSAVLVSKSTLMVFTVFTDLALRWI